MSGPRVALMLVALTAVGCGSWDRIREEMVGPLHEMLHEAYPRALGRKDLQQVEQMYDAAGWRDAAERTRQLIAGFVRLDKVRCVIEKAEQEEAGGLTLQLWLKLDGSTTGGRLCSIEQRQLVTCRRVDGTWRIVRNQPLATRQHHSRWPGFRSAAAERGLTGRHTSRGVIDRQGQRQDYLPGTGLSVRDIDGDGLEELLMVNGGELKLYHNRGGRFVEQSRQRGLIWPSTGECRYALFGDIDNDGDADLFVGVLDGPNQLFHNDGHGRFSRLPAGLRWRRVSGPLHRQWGKPAAEVARSGL